MSVTHCDIVESNVLELGLVKICLPNRPKDIRLVSNALIFHYEAAQEFTVKAMALTTTPYPID